MLLKQLELYLKSFSPLTEWIFLFLYHKKFIQSKRIINILIYSMKYSKIILWDDGAEDLFCENMLQNSVFQYYSNQIQKEIQIQHIPEQESDFWVGKEFWRS